MDIHLHCILALTEILYVREEMSVFRAIPPPF